jgi:hypothetical protein
MMILTSNDKTKLKGENNEGKIKFHPKLMSPNFPIVSWVLQSLVVGSHVWVFVIRKTDWRFAENLVCFFASCNLVYQKFSCLKSKEPQVFCVFVLITICEKLSVYLLYFWFLFGGLWEKNYVCVYLSLESEALLFQVIYQS